MKQYSLIIGIIVKVMHLIWSNEKNRIIKNIVFLKIDSMLSHSLFKPDDLIEAVDMWLDYLTLIFPNMCIKVIKGKLWFIRLMPVQMIFVYYFCFVFTHNNSLSVTSPIV